MQERERVERSRVPRRHLGDEAVQHRGMPNVDGLDAVDPVL
jgi:hypothetical protein